MKETEPTPQTEEGSPSESIEYSFRKRELDLKEREVAAKEREVTVAEFELRRSKWSNPVALALLAAAAGLITNAVLANINNKATQQTERTRGQSSLIVQAVSTGKREDACTNLRFFVDLKLIDDPTGAITKCDPKTGPVLPSAGVLQSAIGLPKQGDCAGLDAVNQRVYHPARLEEHAPCITVSGTLAGIRREADGDSHLMLRLDSGQSFLLNEKNTSEQNGNLVVEIVCAYPVIQPDAKSSCVGYENKINVPNVGQHLSVVGRYVKDLDRGWMEIHPALKITEATQ